MTWHFFRRTLLDWFTDWLAGWLTNCLTGSLCRVESSVMHLADWLPTLLAATGMEAATGMDGLSIWDRLKDPSLPSPRSGTGVHMSPADERNFSYLFVQDRDDLQYQPVSNPTQWCGPLAPNCCPKTGWLEVSSLEGGCRLYSPTAGMSGGPMALMAGPGQQRWGRRSHIQPQLMSDTSKKYVK